MTGFKKNPTPTVIKKPKTSIEICPFFKNQFTRQNADNMNKNILTIFTKIFKRREMA